MRLTRLTAAQGFTRERNPPAKRPRSGRIQEVSRERNLRSQILLLRTEAIPFPRTNSVGEALRAQLVERSL